MWRFVLLLVAIAGAYGQPEPLTRAYEALRVHDYDLAIASFRKVIETAPDRTGIRKDLAYAYLKIGENEAALDTFREVMRRDPADLQVALDYAFLCFESKRQSEARRIFDRVRKTGTAPFAATAEQAFQNIDAPLAAGIARWQKAIEMGANDFSAHFELATLAEQHDDLALAAKHYELAWRALPERLSVLVDLGRTWKALGRAEDATAALLTASRGGEPRASDMARELLPDRYPYVDEFRRALALDSKNIGLRRELAYLLLGMKREVEAEAEFRALAPDDLLSAAQLGFLLHSRGDVAGAKPLFDRVLNGNDPELANRVRAFLHVPQAPQKTSAKEMGERSLKSGYLKDALRYFEAANEADPADAEVQLKLGWTHNLLHQDGPAYYWFGLARKSANPAIAKEADEAWRKLRPSRELLRTSAWLFPIFSSRWHDGFGYAQIKTELRTGLGFRIYASTRFVGDVRKKIGTEYLSEDSVVLGGGISAGPWYGLSLWGEAGSSYNYVTGHMLPDYRGGLSFARTIGHTLRGEAPGLFGDLSIDGVFISRFGNEILAYNQARAGYTAGPKAFRAQLYANVIAVIDDQRQDWARFVEIGPGLRLSGSFLPASMYFTVDALRGRYLLHRSYFNDFRAGFWYAFTR
jgi:tetratricopeptide (TPR) repeat protein